MNISFNLTQPQFRDGSKDVTRRLGWKNLKPGTILNACEKCQGLGKGGKVVVMGQIRVLEVTHEPLIAIRYYRSLPDGRTETAREGFPDLSAQQFISMFMKHMKCDESTQVTRIVFEHVSTKET